MAGLVPFNRRKADLMNTGFSDFQNMLDDFFTDGWSFRRNLAGDTFKLDVSENDKEYKVEAELPGVQKNEISVELEDGRLKIAVNKEENSEEKDKDNNYIHRERRYCSMQRNIILADAADDGVTAKLADGVLSITVPKQVKVDRSRKVDIE